MTNRDQLTGSDHDNLDAFLEHVLCDVKEGHVTVVDARIALAHVVNAMDQGDYEEVRTWISQGRKLIHKGG